MKKLFTGALLILLLMCMLTLTFNIDIVKTSGPIYIRIDGSIEGTTHISTVDDFTYTFNDNINDYIMVERSNIILDGNGYMVQGNGSGIGITLFGESNVTIKNLEIKEIEIGILFYSSSNNTITQNNIVNNNYGILLLESSNNTITKNNITAHKYDGIVIYESSNNRIALNNFVNNTEQVQFLFPEYNNWDNGYPSGGNYWSDYSGADVKSGYNQDQPCGDGIGDTAHVINPNNRDNYPLMKPYPWSSHDLGITNVFTTRTVIAQGNTLVINTTVYNFGNYTETFDITAYTNPTIIYTITDVTLPSRNSTTFTFLWNTIDYPYANYALGITATPTPYETDITDNTHSSWVVVTIMGDVDGDGDVDTGDQRRVQLAMFSVLNSPSWDPNADIDCDGGVDVGDLRKQQLHMFESW